MLIDWVLITGGVEWKGWFGVLWIVGQGFGVSLRLPLPERVAEFFKYDPEGPLILWGGVDVETQHGDCPEMALVQTAVLWLRPWHGSLDETP